MRFTVGILLDRTHTGFSSRPRFEAGKSNRRSFPSFRRDRVNCPKPSPEGLLPSDRQNLGDYGRIGKFHDFVTRYGLDPSLRSISRNAHRRPINRSASCRGLDQAVEKYKSRPPARLGGLLDAQGRVPEG